LASSSNRAACSLSAPLAWNQPDGRSGRAKIEMRAGRVSVLAVLFPARSLALLLQDAGAGAAEPTGPLPTGAAISAGSGTATPLSTGMVAWIHIPKTGASFAKTLYHNRHLCPDFPVDRFLRRDGRVEDFLECSAKLPWSCVNQFCHGAVHELFYGSHRGVGKLVNVVKDHMVGFFRQPEERLIAAWHRGKHSWKGPAPQNISEFADRIQGCQARTLTMDGWRKWEICGNPHKPSKEQVQQAVQLVSNMPFVGLAEHWDFSICLFHKVMNGTCADHDFVNMRPGSKHSNKGDSVKSLLGDWTDPYDTPLYDAAQVRFWALMAENGLNRETCARICAGATKSRPFAVHHEGAHTSNLISHFDWPGRPFYDADSAVDVDYNYV